MRLCSSSLPPTSSSSLCCALRAVCVGVFVYVRVLCVCVCVCVCLCALCLRPYNLQFDPLSVPALVPLSPLSPVPSPPTTFLTLSLSHSYTHSHNTYTHRARTHTRTHTLCFILHLVLFTLPESTDTQHITPPFDPFPPALRDCILRVGFTTSRCVESDCGCV